MKKVLTLLILLWGSRVLAQTPTYANNGAGCPIEYTGTGGSNDSVTSYKCPLPNPTGAGNLLVIWLRYEQGANNPALTFATNLGAITATQATTFTDATQNNTISRIYYIPNIASGITYLQVNFSAFVVRAQMQEYEFYNVATASPLDQATSGGGTSIAVAAPALGSLTTSGDLIVDFGTFINNSAISSCTSVAQANLTWTMRAEMVLDSEPMCFQYSTYNATASFSPAMTFSNSGKWIALAAAFKPATAGTAPSSSGIRVNYVQHDNTENEQATSIAGKLPVSGNLAAMLFTSGCTGTVNNNGGDCAYPTSAPGWTQVGGAILSNFGLDSSGVAFYAANLSPGVLSTTWAMHIRSSGGNGSSFFFYDISGAASSPLDTGFGTSGLASVTYNQVQGGAGGPITTFTATPSQTNEVILSTIGNGFNTNNGITSPAGAQFLACTYVTESNPTHCDLNGGWGLYYNGAVRAAETWTWTHNTSDTPGSGAGIALGIAFSPATVTPALNLPSTPGWHKIPFSELKGTDNVSPCPADNATSPFNPIPPGYLNAPCTRIINAYSSAVADWPRNRMIFWGGGHNDYGGNELYSLELSKAFQPSTNANNPAIVRLTNPSTPNTNTLNADCTDPTWTNQGHTCDVETLIDGRPNARHTGLSALIYSPNTDQMLAFGGSLNDHGSSPGWNVLSLDGSTPATLNANGFIWGLDLSSVNISCAPNCSSSWSALNTTSNSVIIQESAFDPNTGLFYVLPNTQGSAAGPYSFNPVTHAWTQIGNNSLFGNAPELAMDPEDKILLYAGSTIVSGDLCGVRYMSTATGSNFAILTPPGCSTGPLPGCPDFTNWTGNGGNKNGYWPGLVYDEKARKFLFFGGANGGKIVVLDPRSWSCYTETYGSTQDVDQPLDIPLGVTVGGAFVAGHFARFPNLNMEVVGDLGDHAMWTLKRRVGGVQISFASAQTNYVYSRGQAFAQGDIPNWPSAYVDGVQIATTQFDVKNRWPDGSAKYGIVSFVIPSVAAGHIATIDFDNSPTQNNTGFLIKSDMLGAPYNFDAQIQLTGPTTPAAISARTILNAASSCVTPTSDIDGTITSNLCTYWLQGPVVTCVILEDRSAARAYDVNTDGATGNPLHPRFEACFYPQGNLVRVGYNLEDEWASATSTLSARNQTISTVTFTGGNSGPVTEYTQATSFVAHPFTFIRHTYCINGTGAGNPNFCGPVAHVDMNQAYLQSTKFFPNYDSIILTPSVITGAAGGQNSKIFGGCTNCYAGPNAGIGSYNTDINSGGASPMHGTMATWELVWLISQCDAGNATAPACGNGGAGDVLSTVLSNSDFGGNLPFWWREADHNAGTGQTFDNSGVVGNVETRGRLVSLNARTQVNFIDATQQSTPSGAAAWNSGTSYVVGNYVTFVSNGTTNYYYAVAPSTNQAPALTVSPFTINTAFWVRIAAFCTNTNAAEWVNVGVGGYDLGNWSTFAPSDVSTHWPDIAYVSYIVTGEYDYYETVLQQGDMGMWGPGCSGFTAANTSYLRQGSTGYINGGQERGTNWSLRQLGWGAFVAVDGSPEKAYLEDKLYNNLAMLEGEHDIPYDIPGNRNAAWTFGNTSQAAASHPGRHDPAPGQSPLQFWWNISAYISNAPLCGFSGTVGCTVPTMADANFQAGYSVYTIGLLTDIGYWSQAPLNFVMKNYMHRMLDPAANPFAIGDYVFPTQGPSGWATDYTNQRTFIYPPAAATSYASMTGVNCQPPDESYAMMTPMALSYGVTYGISDGTYTATAAYNTARTALTSCVNGTGGSTTSFANSSPKWDLVPRNSVTVAAAAQPPTANTPTFNPGAGTYSSTQNVNISTTSSGAIMCWNTTGSPHTNGLGTGCTVGSFINGTSGTVSVPATATLFAVAGSASLADSPVGSAAYIIKTNITLAPTFNPPAGTYGGGIIVTISAAQGNIICWNTTGAPATNGLGTGCTSGTLINSTSGNVNVPSSETLFAVAGGATFNDGPVGSAAYAIGGGTNIMNGVTINGVTIQP